MIWILLAGCVIGGDRYPRPRDLEAVWLVDRVRVLAIQPEPPEVAPGETVTFEALLADPDGVVQTVVWLACPPTEAGFGCATDLSALPEDPTPAELEEAGVIGIEPFVEPTWTPDEALLAGLTEEEALEGVQATVQLFALPEGEDGEEIDFAEVEVGFKRVVVSEALTPNGNPRFQHLTVEGEIIAADQVAVVEPGHIYTIAAILEEETVERYVYVTSDGVTEERVEEPYTTWYASGGRILEHLVLHPFVQSSWQAPQEPGAEGSWYAVVRDRRGGQAWVERRWRVEE